MGLFGSNKKGNDPFRTLSEKEIQQKLYGHLKTEERFVEELAPKPHYQENFSKSAPTIPSRASHATQDLFKSSAVTEAAQSAPQSLHTASLKDHADKKSPLAFKEAEVPKGSTRVVTPVASKGPGLGDQIQKSFLPAASVLLKTASGKLIEFVAFFLSGILKTAQAVDFRKPVVRRIFFWIAGAAVLIGVFAAINSLNMQRETAMKEARTQPSAAVSNKAKADKEASQAANAKKADKSKAVISQTTAKTVETAAPEQTEQATETSASATRGAYAIQVATFASKNDADNLAKRLEASGLSAFVRSLTRPGGRVYQCVFLGRFATYAEAESKLGEFKKHESAKPFQDAFVRTL